MTDPSSTNKKLIEENGILQKKIQELEELGSEHQQMKETLRESEENYRTLIRKIQTAVVVHGPDTRILSCNPIAQELLGLTEAQLLGKTATDKGWYFFNVDGTEMDVEEYPVNQVIEKRQPLRDLVVGVHRPNKELEKDVWVLINANPVIVKDVVVQVIVTFVDITDRKRAEEALRESERKYRNLYHHAHVGLFETGLLDAKIIACNQRYCDLAGFSTVDSAIGVDTIHLYTNPSDREEVKRLLRKQGYISDHVLQLKNRLTGAIFWAEFSARTNPSREIIEGTIIDITSYKRAEEALKKSQYLLSETERVGKVGGWEFNIETGKQTWTKAIYNIHEVDRSYNPTVENGVNFYAPASRPIIERALQRAITHGEPFDLELEIITAKGNMRSVHVIGKTDLEHHRVYGFFQDITARKRLEDGFLRAQKLESVGLLAGGIAHDFNNILTAIIGNVSMAKTQAKPEDEMFDLLTEAEMASTRAQALTKQLLTFAKGGAPVKETASINEIIKESCSSMLSGSKFISELSIVNDLWPAEVDVGQISQVINNIVINANQAMPEGGIIQVAADNLIIEDSHGLPIKSGRYIKISIKDQGVGIPEKHLLHIFDPFFTTKHEESGLGLATTYSIIKNHDGHITVESQMGVGTTFYIYLPAADKALPEKEATKLITGQSRVLVMDDEASLRKMVGRMLKMLGYESGFAKDGAEAIRIYKEAQEAEEPYDAVILDLTIPGGMGGKETISKLLKIDPEVKAVVSSGYSDDPVMANFQEYGFKEMMPKPFTSRLLRKVLHEVLQNKKE